MPQACIILLCRRRKISVVWLSVLLWEVGARVYDIDILPGGDICHILYKADLILFVM